MKAENTRSNEASGYGSSSANPRSSCTERASRSAFTAADLDDTMIRLITGLVDQLSMDRLEAQQPLERVVKRKQPVVPHPREVGLSRLFHDRASTLFCPGILGVVSHPHLSF